MGKGAPSPPDHPPHTCLPAARTSSDNGPELGFPVLEAELRKTELDRLTKSQAALGDFSRDEVHLTPPAQGSELQRAEP